MWNAYVRTCERSDEFIDFFGAAMHALEAEHCTAYVIGHHFIAFLNERSECCD